MIPDGDAYCTAQFQLTGSTHVSVITCGLGNPGSATAANVELDWRTALSATARPFALANIFVGWTFLKTTALVNIAGVETYAEHVINAAGTKTGTGVPVNGAVLVQKNTGRVGRQFRGRMYVPPFYFVEGDVDPVGNIDSTPLTAYRTLWNSVWTDLDLAAHIPIIIHNDPLVASTPVTDFSVAGQLATQRRRMR